MNIKIPKQIVNNNNQINELIAEFVGSRSFKIPANSESFTIADTVYNNCSQIIFHIDYKNSTQASEVYEKDKVLFVKDLKRLYPKKLNELLLQDLKKKSQ